VTITWASNIFIGDFEKTTNVPYLYFLFFLFEEGGGGEVREGGDGQQGVRKEGVGVEGEGQAAMSEGGSSDRNIADFLSKYRVAKWSRELETVGVVVCVVWWSLMQQLIFLFPDLLKHI
jgi:hypothetical protein